MMFICIVLIQTLMSLIPLLSFYLIFWRVDVERLDFRAKTSLLELEPVNL